MSIDQARLRAAFQSAREELLARRTASGHWTGQLASSSLSTATAISALAIVERRQPTNAEGVFADERAEANLSELIVGGLHWLAKRQNPDGGWGDTDLSLSNIATTMLVKAAFHLTGVPANHADLLVRADAYIAAHGGIPALRRRYGKDKTFAVPILTNCALAGFVPWREVPSLPFELACLRQEWFRFLRLPVVSYAIPALVAIGQAKFYHCPPLNPLLRWVRRAAMEKSLRLVERMQPASGGFLEATPLTSFVVMSLASSGRADHPVTRHGVEFLLRSVREDGSWPIDTNLATWNTTLAVNALATEEGFGVQGSGFRSTRLQGGSVGRKASHAPNHAAFSANEEKPGSAEDDSGALTLSCVEWLLSCQHRAAHAYTGAKPGGWAWTDQSGGVPDADDTAGALLTLAAAHRACSAGNGRRGSRRKAKEHATAEAQHQRLIDAAASGLRWLLELQNADGGWPTFCRGWGALPFDRSASDLTAHALRALRAWRVQADVDVWSGPATRNGSQSNPTRLRSGPSVSEMDEAVERGFLFLAKSQRLDGSWSPLWFGNQFHPDEENPVYGTARVLLAYRDAGRLDTLQARRGLQWLISHQNLDGGWGGAGLGAQMAKEQKKPGSAADQSATLMANRATRRLQEMTNEQTTTARAEPPLRLFNAAQAPDHGPRTTDHGPTEEPPQSTVEETALAVEALLSAPEDETVAACVEAGLDWLIEAVETKQFTRCSPIGFYFAKLWYYEQLYPLIFTVSALGQAVRRAGPPPRPEPAASLSATLNT